MQTYLRRLKVNLNFSAYLELSLPIFENACQHSYLVPHISVAGIGKSCKSFQREVLRISLTDIRGLVSWKAR